MLQKAVIGLAVVAVVGFIIGVGFISSQPEMKLLYGKLNEKDMAEVVTAVQGAGVKYELGAGGTSIYVPADKVHQMRAQLAAKGVPSGDSVGFEIFDRSNFGISDFVQRANYVRALQGELERTISQFNGVRSARVMIVIPENRLLVRETRTKPTASVFIDQGIGGLSREGVNSIRFLVANAVEGLNPNDVAVVDSRGNVLTEGLTDDPTLGLANSQMKMRREIEEYFSKKVETMLIPVVGFGNVVVRVSAELDSENTTIVKSLFDPDSQVARNETTTEDSTLTSEGIREQSVGAGGVGVTANVPAMQAPTPESVTPQKLNEQNRKQRTTTYEINSTTVSTTKTPGGITRLTASVFVARKGEPRTPEQLENLRRMVAHAIGITAKDPAELARYVSLEETVFDQPPPPMPTPEPVTTYDSSGLLRYLIAIGIALPCFYMFWRMFKTAKSEEIPMEILGMNKPAVPEQKEQEKLAISAEMLNEMIRQKPANVGAALRGWMASDTQPSSKE